MGVSVKGEKGLLCLRTMCSIIRYNEARVTWRGEPESRLSEHHVSPVCNRNLQQVLGRDSGHYSFQRSLHLG